jgi:hypothetical protein
VASFGAEPGGGAAKKILKPAKSAKVRLVRNKKRLPYPSELEYLRAESHNQVCEPIREPLRLSLNPTSQTNSGTSEVAQRKDFAESLLKSSSSDPHPPL